MPASKLQWEKKVSGGISTYQGGLYCGPGWGFTLEDVKSGRIQKMPQAIDAIDQACRIHDQCYADHGYFTASCNIALAGNLSKIIKDPNSTPQQRMDAAIMAAFFMVEARKVDPYAEGVKYSYTFMKTTILAMWKSGSRTLGQIIEQIR
jgi:hypothetical protein